MNPPGRRGDIRRMTDTAEPILKPRTIALFAVVVAVAGGVWWWFNKADSDTKPLIAVATSCKGFAADARKLFDNGDAVTLSGTFAPGEQVQLAIDLWGVGYAWELTGVLAKKPEVTGTGSFLSVIGSTSTSTSTVYLGKISGSARLDVELNVETAGDGAITIRKTGSLPSFTRPRVSSASCKPTKKPGVRALQANLEAAFAETRCLQFGSKC
jgi:hypothetical protein